MSTHLDDALARRLLATAPALPSSLRRDVLAFVDETCGAIADVSRIDLAATRSGLHLLRLGRGRTEAPDAAARRICKQARAELAEFLAGERSFFTVAIDLGATAPFQRAVLESARRIPLGEVRSYGWIAAEVGSPGAVRAVGTALGRNPVPLVVPCHRVVRSDGSPGGYAFGAERKRRLLQLERAVPVLTGDARERIVCRTGCARERRLSEDRRIVFASLEEAHAAGYRGCRCTEEPPPGAT